MSAVRSAAGDARVDACSAAAGSLASRTLSFVVHATLHVRCKGPDAAACAPCTLPPPISAATSPSHHATSSLCLLLLHRVRSRASTRSPSPRMLAWCLLQRTNWCAGSGGAFAGRSRVHGLQKERGPCMLRPDLLRWPSLFTYPRLSCVPPPPPPPPAGGACVGRQQRAAAAVADGAPKQGHRGGLQPGGRKCGCHLRCRPHNQGKQRAAHQRVPASSAARLFAPALRAAHQVLYAAAASMAAQLCAAAGSRPAQLSGTAWDCTFACTRAPLAPSQPVTQGAAARPTLSLAAVGPGERLRCAHAHAPQHLQHAGALFRWVPAWLLGTGGCSSHRG